MSPDSQLPVPTPAEIDEGKTMALVSWVSLFVGLPLWIIPMVQRDNAYALFHAKHAAMTYLAAVLLAVIFMVINIVTCGLGAILFPLLLVTMVPTIDGLIKSINGRAEPPLIIGGLTDSIFGGLNVDPSKRKED